MNTLHTLYHIMHADFLERSRRYSFLVTLGLTIFAAYLYLPPASADYLTLGLGNYRGVYNSAWTGGAVAVLCSALLSLPAFYLVKNAINRDEQTRVGQVIATTPISKSLYTLGKTFSNFVFLALMVAMIALAAGAIQLLRNEVIQINLWALFTPFIFSVLPAMAVIAALAVLFETISWLRGTLGNVVYFVLWLILLIFSAANLPSTQQAAPPANDLWGVQVILSGMIKDAAAAIPDYQGSVAIGAVSLSAPLGTFTWNGIRWTPEIILLRMLWLGVALGVGLLSALFFRRFDPAPQKPKSKQSIKQPGSDPIEIAQPARASNLVKLTPIEPGQKYFSPMPILIGELRLLINGIRWWWLIIFAALNAASVLLPVDSARGYLLPMIWILPLALWSALGTREVHHNTSQLIFSAPHPLKRQLPLMWLAGVIVAITVSMGVALNLALAGDWDHLLAWSTGALFIPTLALVSGVWSGSRKPFEVLYLLLWYAGPVNRIENLDFMGASLTAPINRTLVYGMITLLLFVLAVIGRRKQMNR